MKIGSSNRTEYTSVENASRKKKSGGTRTWTRKALVCAMIVKKKKKNSLSAKAKIVNIGNQREVLKIQRKSFATYASIKVSIR